MKKLGLKQPANATARTEDQAVRLAREVGFPLVEPRLNTPLHLGRDLKFRVASTIKWDFES